MRIGDYKYRFIDQPDGWLGNTVQVDWPILSQPSPRSVRAHPSTDAGSMYFANWFTYEFWRFVFVQQEVAQVRQDLHRLPADAGGASFNLDAVKAQIEKAIAQQSGK